MSRNAQQSVESAQEKKKKRSRLRVGDWSEIAQIQKKIRREKGRLKPKCRNTRSKKGEIALDEAQLVSEKNPDLHVVVSAAKSKREKRRCGQGKPLKTPTETLEKRHRHYQKVRQLGHAMKKSERKVRRGKSPASRIQGLKRSRKPRTIAVEPLSRQSEANNGTADGKVKTKANIDAEMKVLSRRNNQRSKPEPSQRGQRSHRLKKEPTGKKGY